MVWHVLPYRQTFEREPMLVLQHLLPVRKAHVRIMHRPLRHVRQHRLRRRRVRNPGRRMGVRRMRTETRPGEKNGCSTPSKTMRARNNTRRPKPSTASSAASSTASKQDRWARRETHRRERPACPAQSDPPLGPLVREVYGMPAPAKKHGNR